VTAAPDRLAAALADRYRVEREVGQGGMATVYLAEDLKHHRRVALKVLRPELAASLGADRFFREIEVAAKLQHPHILPLHDSGEAGPFLYYVMPFVDGDSLRGRLARGGELPIHDAVRILAEVADALAYAHGHGVVHRDIKPDNVLLSGRHALVTDFGVAKAVSEATGRQQLTTAGVALGTPAYMAPEQAAAEVAHSEGPSYQNFRFSFEVHAARSTMRWRIDRAISGWRRCCGSDAREVPDSVRSITNASASEC
jgi:serine/threonine protein kinase